jgi:ribosomal protein S19E (S16A)
MSSRDVVLEGARPAEIEALFHLSANPGLVPPPEILRRLEAKGWIDSFNDTHVLTVAGRTLLDAR